MNVEVYLHSKNGTTIISGNFTNLKYFAITTFSYDLT